MWLAFLTRSLDPYDFLIAPPPVLMRPPLKFSCNTRYTHRYRTRRWGGGGVGMFTEFRHCLPQLTWSFSLPLVLQLMMISIQMSHLE